MLQDAIQTPRTGAIWRQNARWRSGSHPAAAATRRTRARGLSRFRTGVGGASSTSAMLAAAKQPDTNLLTPNDIVDVQAEHDQICQIRP